MKDQSLPEFLRPFLWSYDLKALDGKRDKKRIITQILNFGSKEATDWLFSVYSKEEITQAITEPLAGEWDRKSLNYWSLALDAKPGSTTRNIK